MAVWNATTYKLDIAKDIYEKLPAVVSKVLGDTIGEFLSPTATLSGLSAEDDWDDLALRCNWDSTLADGDAQEKFMKKFAQVTRWVIGSSALFHIIHAVSNGRFVVKAPYDYVRIQNWAAEIGNVIAPSTQIAPKKFIAAWGRMNKDYSHRGRIFEAASEGFKAMRIEFERDSNQVKKIDQERHFGTGDRCYYGVTLGNLCILKGAGDFVEKGLIFTRSHLNLLVEALMRIANTYEYLATEYVDEPEAAAIVDAMLHMTMNDAARARGKNADKVVQAYHKGRMYAQMAIFENCHTGATEEALLEFRTKGLNDVFDLNAYMALITEAPVNRRLDVMQVYKWMVPPDYDSTYSFADLFNWHMNPRASGADPDASSEMVANWRLVQAERKRNIVVAYHAKCHEWPIYNETIQCQPNNIHLWELTKLFPYHSYGTDIVTQIKDKSTVSASKKRELANKSEPDEKSFLLWYLANAGSVDTEVDANLIANGYTPEDNYVKVAYKGEAHKPGSRLFFMAPPHHRILLGELEGNISDVAAFYPGSLQGKDSHQKAEMLQKLFDVYEAPPGVDATLPYEVYVITFDLSKFSPKSNYEVTKDYHAFWATVFGRASLENLVIIGPNSDIVHLQSGLTMEYQNIGADLEGFRGRLMTLFHADMLGAACRKARAENVTVGKAVLAVFIDDGAVKVAVSGYDEEASANANRFLEIMQEIYASAGQENHPNKTIVSKVGGELLAEQYLHGQRLKVPIKAAMRLYPDYENPASAITEEFDSIFAAAQGCVKDQGLWSPTYFRYVVAVLKAISRWSRGCDKYVGNAEMALKIITPKSYGGFGLQPWQGLVSTTTLNLTAEGFGMLNRAARMYPELRGKIYAIMAKRVVVRDPLLILRDPERVRAEGLALTENRLMMAIITALEAPGNPAARFMAGYRAEELRVHAREVALAMMASESISVPALARAWDATPLAYVESVVGKFRRARTIIEMLGYKRIAAIRKKNSEEVRAILMSTI